MKRFRKLLKKFLEKKETKINVTQQEKWNQLNTGEKLFYTYLIENDIGLSSILVGVFSAYVVNIFSNLMSCEFDSFPLVLLYMANAIFSVRALYFIVKLYSFHEKKERIAENDRKDVYWNKYLEQLFSDREKIKTDLHELALTVGLLAVTLLLYCALNNHLDDLVCKFIHLIANKIS